MNCLTVLALALCLVAVHCVPQKVDLFNKGSRIVGGVPATQEQGTHQCSLHAEGWFGKSHICGCSLYGKNFAITAAHCTDGSQAAKLEVRYNGLTLKSLAVTNQVKEIRQHESYDTPTDSIDNDITVLVLTTDIVEVTGQVSKVTLADTVPAVGADAHLTGWGNTKSGSGSSTPTVLQYQKLQIVSNEECEKIYNQLPQD
ncbi:unnamed protein product, partial [Medioppia subpectinata]